MVLVHTNREDGVAFRETVRVSTAEPHTASLQASMHMQLPHGKIVLQIMEAPFTQIRNRSMWTGGCMFRSKLSVRKRSDFSYGGSPGEEALLAIYNCCKRVTAPWERGERHWRWLQTVFMTLQVR